MSVRVEVWLSCVCLPMCFSVCVHLDGLKILSVYTWVFPCVSVFLPVPLDVCISLWIYAWLSGFSSMTLKGVILCV